MLYIIITKQIAPSATTPSCLRKTISGSLFKNFTCVISSSATFSFYLLEAIIVVNAVGIFDYVVIIVFAYTASAVRAVTWQLGHCCTILFVRCIVRQHRKTSQP